MEKKINDYINEIICGDNVEVLKEFPDSCIDLTVTSPPYDNLRTYNGFEWDFEGLARELYRVTKKGGVVVWVVGDATINGSETGTSFRQALFFKEIGFRLHDTMIYAKENWIPLNHNRYDQQFEYMFVFSKEAPKTFNPLMMPTKEPGKRKIRSSTKKGHAIKGRRFESVTPNYKRRGNIFKYKIGRGLTTKDYYAFEHPAVFPEQLAEDHIISWSNPGDIVLDPFIGSGTTAKMALLNGRRYIGIDISEEYCELARKRIEDAVNRDKGEHKHHIKTTK